MYFDHHIAFPDACLEPVSGKIESVFLFESSDHFGDVAVDAYFVQQALDLLFILVLVEQYLEYLWCCFGVNLEDEGVDVLPEFLVVEELRDEFVNLVVAVANGEDREWVLQFAFNEVVTQTDGVLHFISLDHADHFLFVIHFQTTLNLLLDHI